MWVSSLSIAEPLGLIIDSGDKAAIYDPWQITFYLSVGIAVGIIVSLLTPATQKDRLDLFYSLTRTPIQPGEEIKEPCTLPPGVAANKRPMLITALGLEIPRPSVTSIVGFVAGWVCVAILIGGFVWLVSI